MTKQRFNVEGKISGFHVGERIVDYDFLEKQIKKYRSPENFIIEITDDGHSLTYKECCDLLNNYAESNESLQKKYKKQEHLINNLKEQIIIYEEFLKGNDLDIEWDLFCTADICKEEEDIDCKYCKYMRWIK